MKLKAVVCIGSVFFPNRYSKEVDEKKDIEEQLECIKGSVGDWNKIVLVYDPMWHFYRGVTLAPEVAEEMHLFIRKWVADHVH